MQISNNSELSLHNMAVWTFILSNIVQSYNYNISAKLIMQYSIHHFRTSTYCSTTSSHLPVVHSALPLCQLLQCLKLSHALIDEECDVLHCFPGALQLVMVWVIGWRIVKEILQLQMIFTDFLHGRQQEALQIYRDHLLQKPTCLKQRARMSKI